MPTFSADQIIGKTLIAKKPVPLYTSATKRFGSFITVPAGRTVGVVYSYVGGTGGDPLYWMFYAKLQGIEKAYYAEHLEDAFDGLALKDQGVKTDRQIEEAKKEENLSTGDKILEYLKKYAMWAGIGLAGFLVFREILRKK
jgi:hypothetical protein